MNADAFGNGLPDTVSLTALLLGIVFIASLTIGATRAWGQGSNLTLLAALQEIRTAIGTLKTSVDNLTAPDQSNVRTTPPMSSGTGPALSLVTCSVVNVAPQSRTVRVQSTGTANPIDTTQTLLSNQSLSIAVASVGSNVHCTFTVADGTRADIRGSMAFQVE